MLARATVDSAPVSNVERGGERGALATVTFHHNFGSLASFGVAHQGFRLLATVHMTARALQFLLAGALLIQIHSFLPQSSGSHCKARSSPEHNYRPCSRSRSVLRESVRSQIDTLRRKLRRARNGNDSAAVDKLSEAIIALRAKDPMYSREDQYHEAILEGRFGAASKLKAEIEQVRREQPE